MNKKYRKQLQAFVPDSTDVDLETVAVVTDEDTEAVQLDGEVVEYLCLGCFASWSKTDLDKRKPDECPGCHEEMLQEGL